MRPMMRSEEDEVRTFQFISVTCAHMPMEKPQGDEGAESKEKEFPKKQKLAESSFWVSADECGK